MSKLLTNEQLRKKLADGYDPLHLFLTDEIGVDRIEDPTVARHWRDMQEFAYEAIRHSMRIETELQRAVE